MVSLSVALMAALKEVLLDDAKAVLKGGCWAASREGPQGDCSDSWTVVPSAARTGAGSAAYLGAALVYKQDAVWVE